MKPLVRLKNNPLVDSQDLHFLLVESKLVKQDPQLDKAIVCAKLSAPGRLIVLMTLKSAKFSTLIFLLDTIKRFPSSVMITEPSLSLASRGFDKVDCRIIVPSDVFI